MYLCSCNQITLIDIAMSKLNAAERAELIFDSIVDMFKIVSPCVVLIDDAHYMDALSCKLLNTLLKDPQVCAIITTDIMYDI